MALFRVTWEIDLDGVDTPEDAARKALRIQRNPESTATVFKVRQRGRRAWDGIPAWCEPVEIDLDELDAAKVDYPSCMCGHAAIDHHHSPSGCGTSHCEFGTDPDTGAPGCSSNCREYEPVDEEAWQRAYDVNAKGAAR